MSENLEAERQRLAVADKLVEDARARIAYLEEQFEQLHVGDTDGEAEAMRSLTAAEGALRIFLAHRLTIAQHIAQLEAEAGRSSLEVDSRAAPAEG